LTAFISDVVTEELFDVAVVVLLMWSFSDRVCDNSEVDDNTDEEDPLIAGADPFNPT
jgi:hypothetical protein